jgi:hypothetical protein
VGIARRYKPVRASHGDESTISVGGS